MSETPQKTTEELKEIYKNVHERVLVACPTYKGKSYALEAYIRAYNDFAYPHRALFMVDNTGDGLRFYEHLKSLNVDVVHINPTRDFQETLAMCWKRILREAKKGGCDWVMSIEADNICPPLTLDAMLNVAGFCKALHVAHSYPWHKSQADMGLLTGLGCNLIHVSLLDAVFSRKKWLTDAFEAEIYEYPKIMGYPVVELHNLLDIRHLDDDRGAEYYHFDREELPEFTKNYTAEKKPIQYKNKPKKEE
jgi:hypothetical protein